jgi:catechol 2,3-dioxygenase-like lactoylglutathione lyase family enzyme
VSIGYLGDNVPALTLTSHAGEAPDGEPIKLDQVGITHLAFIMPNLKAFTEAILAKGVELAGPREAFFDTQGNVRSIYVKDPEGILI